MTRFDAIKRLRGDWPRFENGEPVRFVAVNVKRGHGHPVGTLFALLHLWNVVGCSKEWRFVPVEETL